MQANWPWEGLIDMLSADPTLLDGVRSWLLLEPYKPDSEVDPLKLASKASTAFAVAMLEKKTTEQPYSEGFRELLDVAERNILLFDQVLRGRSDKPELDHDRKTMSLLELLLDIEFFKVKMHLGDYEEAVHKLSGGLIGLYMYMERQPEYVEPPVTDFDPQEAVNCFEMLRAQPQKVKSWEEVALSCTILADIWQDIGVKKPEGCFKASEGTTWSWEQYWSRAQYFAEARLSPDEYRAWQEREEREHAERHMAHLFFPGTWKQLPELARDALVQAEVMWWARDRSTKSAVVDNPWKATREIVLERLVTPFGHYAASGPIKGFVELKAVSLLTDGSGRPDLSELMKVTWQAPQFPEFAKTLGLGQQEYQFLLSVEKDLWRLIKLRNRSVHPDKGETVEPHDIEWAYRKFLGVGCEGILPRLAKLETSTPQAKSH